ncbi:MAG: hypothetical protein V1913_12430 [Fibrobacterota bacterium]
MKPTFPKGVAERVESGQVNITTAKFLAGLAESDRAPLLSLFSALRFGVNKQREIVEWLEDVIHRDGVSVPDLCRSLELDALLSDAMLNSPQKCSRFRERLYALRFPALSAHLQKLHQDLRRIRLPEGVRLSVESPLEDAVYKLEIEFHSREELEEKLKQLPLLPPF